MVPVVVNGTWFSPGHISDIEHRRESLPAEEFV
jgi:hypothetical protein